jgi:hypothetical protein
MLLVDGKALFADLLLALHFAPRWGSMTEKPSLHVHQKAGRSSGVLVLNFADGFCIKAKHSPIKQS